MQKITEIILLLLLLGIAVFLRFYCLDSIPSGFINDEAAVGYNAYSLIKTGRDEFGISWPLVFESFGEGKPGMMVYHVLPWIKILGLTEIAVRVSPALFSVITILISYLLTLEIFANAQNKKTIAYLNMLILAFMPWDIFYARGGAFGHESLFWATLSVYLFLKWQRIKNIRILLLCSLSASISMLSYHSARVFVPIILFSLWLMAIKNLKLKDKILSLLIMLLSSGILWIWLMISPVAGSRAAGVSILHPQSGVGLKLNLDITESVNQPLWLVRLMHNKFVAYFRDFSLRYFSHFDSDFLFFSGDPLPRYQIPNHGLLLSICIPFLAFGIYLMLRYKKWVLILWLLAAPIVSAITFQTPSASRARFMIIPLSILTAWGFGYFYEHRAKLLVKIAIPFIIFIFIWQFTVFWDAYAVHAQVREPYHWQVGYKEMVTKVMQLKNNYHNVKVTDKKGTPYIFFLFYTQYNPKRWQEQSGGSKGDLDVFHFQSMKYLDNIEFVSEKCPASFSQDPNTLYVCVNEEIPGNARTIETIRYNNGEPAFIILDFKKP